MFLKFIDSTCKCGANRFTITGTFNYSLFDAGYTASCEKCGKSYECCNDTYELLPETLNQ